MNISRRWFLGGAISLVAVQTFVPSVSTMSNLPIIYGDGSKDDTEGLGAIFRNEPCIFKKDMIGVDSHEGLTFHKGKFIVKNTIHIPLNTKFEIEKAEFIGLELPDNFPFFHCEDNSCRQFTDNDPGAKIQWQVKSSYKSRFVTSAWDIDKYQAANKKIDRSKVTFS